MPEQNEYMDYRFTRLDKEGPWHKKNLYLLR